MRKSLIGLSFRLILLSEMYSCRSENCYFLAPTFLTHDAAVSRLLATDLSLLF